MSGLAIAGIGCASILMIMILAGGVLLWKGCSMVGDFAKHPGKLMTLAIEKSDPDLQVVKADDDAKELTIRNKKTGEVTTLSYNDVSQGKLKVKNSKGEEVVIDPANQDGKGNVVVKNSEGTTVVGGDPALTAPPAWVPLYPAALAKTGGMRSEKADKMSGIYTVETSDPMNKVKDFYEPKLKEAGFKTETMTFNNGKGDTTTLSGAKENYQLTVTATQEDGKTTIAITYDGPKS